MSEKNLTCSKCSGKAFQSSTCLTSSAAGSKDVVKEWSGSYCSFSQVSQVLQGSRDLCFQLYRVENQCWCKVRQEQGVRKALKNFLLDTFKTEQSRWEQREWFISLPGWFSCEFSGIIRWSFLFLFGMGVRDKGQTLRISKGPHSGMLWLSKHF